MQSNACGNLIFSHFEIFHLNSLFFIFRIQDVLLHCKIARCRINRLTRSTLSALKASMAAYRKCFFSKWLKFRHLSWSEIWHFMWVIFIFNLLKKIKLNLLDLKQRPPVSFFVDNLESSSSYRLILFAVNAKGRSEPVILDDISFKGVAKFTGEFNGFYSCCWLLVWLKICAKKIIMQIN